MTQPADFSTYGINWSGGSSSPWVTATGWTTTATFPVAIPIATRPTRPAV
ncbi:hypothetical protein [Roseateles terrae]|uniref:Uncharacterized protein n=1 Tax=Roseateles terrae TaxID=431060 RepID=A0ABR6GPU9_9BURK|nr:hypothetical protein [Roseateles terrae]MBB3193726.1 hypothetical protein [Roseateles terrae]